MGIKVILVVGFGGSGRKETLVLGIKVILVGGFRCQQKETGPRHQSDPHNGLQAPAEGDDGRRHQSDPRGGIVYVPSQSVVGLQVPSQSVGGFPEGEERQRKGVVGVFKMYLQAFLV